MLTWLRLSLTISLRSPWQAAFLPKRFVLRY
jgi:hypothetical protein